MFGIADKSEVEITEGVSNSSWQNGGHNRATANRSLSSEKQPRSLRVHAMVLAVLVRVLTRPSDQFHTKMIPDVDYERNTCEKKSGPQIDADGHKFAFSVNHICVNLCSSVGKACRAPSSAISDRLGGKKMSGKKMKIGSGAISTPTSFRA
jgi:hypothetical protein